MVDPAEDETIGYYNRNAGRFAADTADLDLSPLYERFLGYLPPGGSILDAGCGVGRDIRAFIQRGFAVVGFDGSIEMVQRARERAGGLAQIYLMRFDDVAWQDTFDGIWACASLLHVPSSKFSSVAARLASALRVGGAWYMSFKVGSAARQADGRLFTDYTEAAVTRELARLSIRLADVWSSGDVRVDRRGERWLNIIGLRL